MATVLIIDEDDEVLAFIREALTAADHDAVAVGSVRMAEKLLASEVFDAVVLEVILKDKEGIETILQLKELWPHCPVIAMSAGAPRFSARDALALARAVGANETLTKPFPAYDLIAALDRAITACGAREGENASKH